MKYVNTIAMTTMAIRGSHPKAMAGEFNSDLKAKLERFASETGKHQHELVEAVAAGYFKELASFPEMLRSRYDDLKSGRGTPVSRNFDISSHQPRKAAAVQP